MREGLVVKIWFTEALLAVALVLTLRGCLGDYLNLLFGCNRDVTTGDQEQIETATARSWVFHEYFPVRSSFSNAVRVHVGKVQVRYCENFGYSSSSLKSQFFRYTSAQIVRIKYARNARSLLLYVRTFSSEHRVSKVFLIRSGVTLYDLFPRDGRQFLS